MAEPLDVKQTWMIYLPLPAEIRSRLPPMVSLPLAEARALVDQALEQHDSTEDRWAAFLAELFRRTGFRNDSQDKALRVRRDGLNARVLACLGAVAGLEHSQ